MKPTVFSVTSVEQIEVHLQGVRQEGLAPTLAIIFSSVVHNLKELCAVFAKHDIEVSAQAAAERLPMTKSMKNRLWRCCSI